MFKRAETMYAYHWSLHANDRIRVGPWEGPDLATRRMVFLVPYQAPGWFKRAVGALALALPDARECPRCLAPGAAAGTRSAPDGQAYSSACLLCLALRSLVLERVLKVVASRLRAGAQRTRRADMLWRNAAGCESWWCQARDRTRTSAELCQRAPHALIPGRHVRGQAHRWSGPATSSAWRRARLGQEGPGHGRADPGAARAGGRHGGGEDPRPAAPGAGARGGRAPGRDDHGLPPGAARARRQVPAHGRRALPRRGRRQPGRAGLQGAPPPPRVAFCSV